MTNTTTGITSASFAKFQSQPASPEDEVDRGLGVNRDGQGYTLPDAEITVADCGQQAVYHSNPDMTQNPLSKPSNRK